MKVSLVGLICMLLAPAAWAQTTAGIAGVVKDASGGVLPGVTVEAASPALIEKVRTVVTDGEGRYNIVSLPTGSYIVTFSLTGFNTFKREGIELTAGFTAPLNAELRVGSLAETVTVTGESPLVDTSSVRQQTVVSKELLEALPSSVMGGSVLISMTPGFMGTASLPDVGGSAGYRDGMGSNANNAEFHGRYGMKYNIDGLSIMSVVGTGTFSFVPNPLLLGETTIETGGSAESSGSGFTMNALPKEGANKFSFMFTGLFSNQSMQSDNLTDDWIRRGVKSAGSIDYLWDVGGTAGGPIRRDKVWFFSAAKTQKSNTFETDNFYNATQNTLLYTKDLSRPANTDNLQRSGGGRLTWQLSQRHKLNFTADIQNNCVCRQANALQAPEAKFRWHFYPSYVAQAMWNAPLSNRLLLEAAAGVAISHWDAFLQPEVERNNVQVTDTGYTYGFGTPRDPDRDERYIQRASLSYVTGTHTVKVGMTIEQLIADYGIGFVPGGKASDYNVDLAYTFVSGVPSSITQRSTPYLTKDRVTDLGIFAQDQWAIKRLTVNYGVRFEYFNGHVPAQDVAATRFVPARHFDRVDGVPKWKDFNPRVGAAYDLFGTGRTAVKFAVGRYLTKESTSITSGLNPINTSINNVTRSWADTNKNYIPDCDLTNFAQNLECGQITNFGSFGKSNVTLHWADDALQGFGVRPPSWDITTEVQQQLGRSVSLTAGYNRSWQSNFRVTDNLALTPADYDTYCITAPKHPDLPGGGGYQVCGLADIKPAKFTAIADNLVTQSSHYGDQKRVADFFNMNIDTRFKSGMLIRGGIDSGRIMTDNCFVIDSPQDLLNCHSAPPLLGRTQIKLQGSYPLPYDTVVSAIFQNVPSVAYGASYRATNAEIFPSLGRVLAACGTRTLATCTSIATVPLINPNLNFEKRRTQLDLRLTKAFRMSGGRRLQANFDLYNALNSAALLTTNSNFALVKNPWRNPTAILSARLMQVSGRITF